jgi:SAM-dependent methyltransferase
MLKKRGVKYARILRKHIPKGRFLDIGAAAGFIVEGMTSTGWTGIGLEPNDAMATNGRSRGFDIRTGSFGSTATHVLSGIRDEGAAPQFDAVLMIQVIAHLGDPKDAIRQAHQLLRPGGVLLIETWDRASFMARVTKLGWHEYSPPSVVHWFTKTELDSCADSLGFLRIAKGLMPKWITAEHAASLLQSGRASVPVAARIAAALPAKFSLPYPGDDLFWVLYQRGVD